MGKILDYERPDLQRVQAVRLRAIIPTTIVSVIGASVSAMEFESLALLGAIGFITTVFGWVMALDAFSREQQRHPVVLIGLVSCTACLGTYLYVIWRFLMQTASC